MRVISYWPGKAIREWHCSFDCAAGQRNPGFLFGTKERQWRCIGGVKYVKDGLYGSNHRLLPLHIPEHTFQSQISPLASRLIKAIGKQDPPPLKTQSHPKSFVQMTPSGLHILHEAANSATPNPRSPPNLLPTGAAATAMLTLGAVAAGGLYTVVRIILQRLAVSVSKKNEDENNNENERKNDKEPKEDEKQLPIDTILIAKASNLYPSVLVLAEHATEIKLVHQEPSNAFEFWEKTTLNRINGAKQRRLDQQRYSIPDIDAWYDATMGRFQHEREKRLVKVREQEEEAARVWALRKIREEQEERGMDTICAWAERGQ